MGGIKADGWQTWYRIPKIKNSRELWQIFIDSSQALRKASMDVVVTRVMVIMITGVMMVRTVTVI